MLDAGASVDIRNNNGGTVLMLAARYGHLDVVRYLLEAGASVGLQIALGLAAGGGHLDVVKELLDAGASVDMQDNFGNTALMRATWDGHLDVVRYLLEAGASVDLQNEDGKTVLDIAKDIKDQPYRDIGEIIQLLSRTSIDPNAINPKTGLPNLLAIASKGPTRLLKEFVEQPLNFDFQDATGKTALIHAVLNNKGQHVDLLLTTGADPNLTDNEEMSPLAYAVKLGNEEIAQILVESGADLDETIDIVGKKYKRGQLLKELRQIPAIDIKETCISEDDPITLLPLTPRGTISIKFPGPKKDLCYDLSSLRSYIRSQGDGKYGLDPNREYVDYYEIPTRYYIDIESGKILLKSKARRYRADLFQDKVRIDRVENPVYMLTEI